MDMAHERRQGGLLQRISPELVLLTLICAGYVVTVLSLPIFPTQDGPVHLYYTHVLQALFSKQPSVYTQFYYIKHLLPPYSLYYYSLLLLAKFVPLFMADKIVICCYFVSFVFGFRYLARAIGPNADSMALLATLVLLNWPLGMGFVNFCGSLSLSLWCLGLWLRASGRRDYPRKIGFLVLLYLVMLAHPVPLLPVLGICLLDVLLRVVGYVRNRSQAVPAFLLEDMAFVVVAMGALGYVALFTSSHLAKQVYATAPLAQRVTENILMYARGRGLAPFTGTGLNVSVARLSLLLVVPVALLLALVQRLRNRAWTLGDRFFVLTVLLIVAMPFVPHDMNASHFFADRLLIFIWLAALMAASGLRLKAWPIRAAVILLAVVGNVMIYRAAQQYIRPAAVEVAKIEQAPHANQGELGLMLTHAEPPPASHEGLFYNPYLWARAHYFRHNNAVLENTPWMDLTVIPLGALPTLPNGRVPAFIMEDPAKMETLLLESPEERARLLPGTRFIVANRGMESVAPVSEPVVEADAGARVWKAAGAQLPWYAVWDQVGR